MKIFGVFLKILSILTVVAAAAGCTLVSVEAGNAQAWIFLACLFAGISLMALAAWGAGSALVQAQELKEKANHLEQQVASLSRTLAALSARQTRAPEMPETPPEPWSAPRAPSPQRETRLQEDPRLAEYLGNASPRTAIPNSQKSPLPAQRPVRQPQPQPEKPQTGKWVLLGLLALVLVVVTGGALGYFLGGSRQEEPLPPAAVQMPAAVQTPASGQSADTIPLALGETIDNEHFTMTFETLELAEEYTYSTGEHSSISLYVEEGYQLLMLRGHFTNKSTAPISDSAFYRTALVNGTYQVDGSDVRINFQRSKYFEIDPYTDLDYVLYVNIPKKLAAEFETATFTLAFKNDLSLLTTTYNLDGSTTVDADLCYAISGVTGSAPAAAAPAAPAATEAVPAEPVANTISPGQTIVTDQYEFTLNKVELTYEVLPPNTTGVYSSYAAESGKVYVHVDAAVKNTMKRDLRIDELFQTSVLYDGEYPYSGFPIVNSGDNNFHWAGNYVAATPLETCGAHGLVSCPKEVETSGKSIVVSLDLGGTTYQYTLR